MGMPIREHTIEQIEERLNSMNTTLNKINYLESAINVAGFGFEIKKFILKNLADLYDDRKMYDRAARAMLNKAGVEASVREKMDSYMRAAEFYAKSGRVEDADEMFIRAMKDASMEQKQQIKLARKNIYMEFAKDLEAKGRKASSVKFYEKLIKIKLDESERIEIVKKLISIYKALGMFREARMLEGSK